MNIKVNMSNIGFIFYDFSKTNNYQYFIQYYSSLIEFLLFIIIPKMSPNTTPKLTHVLKS